MDKKSTFLTVGIADLSLSYLLFTSQQYFSLLAMVCILALTAIGFAIMLLLHCCEPDAKVHREAMTMLTVLSLISAAIVVYEIVYGLAYVSLPPNSSIYIILLAVAILVFSIGLYLVRKTVGSGKTYKSYALTFASLIIISILIYLMLAYKIHAAQWKGTDEMVFNYYASYLLLHGTNPYAAMMMPALTTYQLTPTYGLDGRCECSYDYPALGFLLLTLLPLSTQNFLHVLVLVALMLVVFVAFLLYRKSGNDGYALLPITAWFAAVFYFYPDALTGLIAVSLLLLLAYIYRSRTVLCSILLGLAVSTHPLAWFVVPFFFVMILRSSGKGAALKSVLITIAIFAIVNGYFIAISPYKTVGNILSLFFVKLQFSGPSLIQLLVAFFPVAYWSLTLTMAVAFVLSLALFYLYTDTLRPLLAVAPMAVLFLSWRNMPAYAYVFIPLLIAVYYTEKDGIKDIMKDKRMIACLAVPAMIFVACALLYAHMAYVQSDLLKVVSAGYAVETNAATGTSVISNMTLSLMNNAGTSENIVFYFMSRDPDMNFYTIDNEAEILPSGSNYTYVFPIQSLRLLPGKTDLHMFVLSNDYIASVDVTRSPS